MASFTRILTVPSGLCGLGRDFALAQAFEVRELDGAPLRRRQRAQRGRDAPFVAPPLRLQPRAKAAAPAAGRPRLRGACDRSSGDGPRAQAVDGAAARDGDDPGDGAASAGVELGGPPPHFQERLLDDVLGLFPVAQDPKRDRDRPRRVLIVEVPQRGDVALGDAREKLPVARPIARTGGHGGYELGQAPFNIGCANRQRKRCAHRRHEAMFLLELRLSVHFGRMRPYFHRRGTNLEISGRRADELEGVRETPVRGVRE